MTVTHAVQRDKYPNPKDTSLVLKNEQRCWIDRTWGPYLKASETKVIGFIFTHTHAWGRAGCRLAVPDFIHGTKTSHGTGLSDKTVRRTLATLEALGAITRERLKYGYRITLDMDWNPTVLRTPKAPQKARTVQLAAPKAHRKTPSSSIQTGQNDQARLVKMTGPTKEDQLQEEERRKNSPAARALDEAQQDADSVEGREARAVAPSVNPDRALSSVEAHAAVRRLIDLAGRKKAADQVKATAKAKDAPATFDRLWAIGFQEAFPSVTMPAWTGREHGQVKLFLRETHPSGRDPQAFLAWCVQAWPLIINTRFAWMQDRAPPQWPEIGFLLAFRKTFYEAWNDRERLRHELTLTGVERRTQRLVRRGLTHEEAAREAAARDGLAQERIKLAEAQRELNERMQRADARDLNRNPDRFVRVHRPSTTKAQPVRPTLGGDDAF